jgi:hypothetical protein
MHNYAHLHFPACPCETMSGCMPHVWAMYTLHRVMPPSVDIGVVVTLCATAGHWFTAPCLDPQTALL